MTWGSIVLSTLVPRARLRRSHASSLLILKLFRIIADLYRAIAEA